MRLGLSILQCFVEMWCLSVVTECYTILHPGYQQMYPRIDTAMCQLLTTPESPSLMPQPW